MASFEIRHVRNSSSICTISGPDIVTFKDAVEQAVRQGYSLEWADLRKLAQCDLRGARFDNGVFLAASFGGDLTVASVKGAKGVRGAINAQKADAFDKVCADIDAIPADNTKMFLKDKISTIANELEKVKRFDNLMDSMKDAGLIEQDAGAEQCMQYIVSCVFGEK